MMPHLAEELWCLLGQQKLAVQSPWPQADKTLLIREKVKMAVQVNGKMRGTIEISRDASEEEATEKAMSLATVIAALKNEEVKKVIYVPNRIINVIY